MSEHDIERILVWAIMVGVVTMAAGFLAMGYRRIKERRKAREEQLPHPRSPEK